MRLYNGCPDSELQARLDTTAALKGKLSAVSPEARCVYFPAEPSPYSVWLGTRQVTPFFWTQDEALRDAIQELGRDG